MLTAILNELHGEIGVLDNCRQFMAEFTQMKAGIQPWLDNKPKFEDIQECRKMIRALKSKLRHKEADRQDLEEVCGCFVLILVCMMTPVLDGGVILILL